MTQLSWTGSGAAGNRMSVPTEMMSARCGVAPHAVAPQREARMTQRLTDANTGETTHRIRSDRLTDADSGETTHRIRGNRIVDVETGETTHRIRNGRITDADTGETTHRIRH